jgi:HD-like signal output (HDOD) protein/DNA-binding NarL/FixJ family response regulator
VDINHNNLTYRALVVDDEAIVRKLLVMALTKQGFHCDSAADGKEAEDQYARFPYDAVVTDLRMPQMHGYALMTYLLAQKRKPVMVVHTGVMEPRLANDLLLRGVDDVIFKPFDLGVLATKVKTLVKRRFPNAELEGHSLSNAGNEICAEESDSEAKTISLPDLREKMTGVAQLLPISTAALDVYQMTGDVLTKIPQLAAAIQRDAAFTAEILRHANSSFYNSSRQPIIQLDKAVVRVGQKRIGELALGMSALRTMTSNVLPWMDINLVWKQSMAAGLAIDLLVEQGKHQALDDGLMLSSIMHPLGRIILATLYPSKYERMIKKCCFTGDSLPYRECIAFPQSHTEVLSNVLTTWNIPKEVFAPLKLLQEDYSTLIKAAEPIRTKAELVKLAIFIGRIAVGQWEPWDEIDLPPGLLLKRLGITSIKEIIEQTREDVGRLATFNVDQSSAKIVPTAPAQFTRQLSCCDLSGGGFNSLAMLLLNMEIKPVVVGEDEMGQIEGPLLVNCLGNTPNRLAGRARSSMQLLIVTDSERESRYKDYGRTIVLPASYSRLRAVCWDAAQPIEETPKVPVTTFSQWAK